MTDFIAIRAQSQGTYRTEKLGGTEYIVVPVVALVEGVLQGVTAEQPELALASEFGRFPMAWNGRPITIDHPWMEEGGEVIRVSASQSPDVLEDFQVGFIFNSKLDSTGKKLQMEAWIDPVKANNHSDAARVLLAKIRRGERIEVSTGLFTGSERAEGTYSDRQYFGIWRGVVPDHLALLPDGLIGACSNEDGCGVYANSKPPSRDAGLIRVHALRSQCSCGGHDVSQHTTQPQPGGVSKSPGTSLTSPTGNAALLSFKHDEFLANMVPDGLMDQDIRQLLQGAIADSYPGAYAYLIGFTNSVAVFSMYDSIDGDRDTYQISYSIDTSSKEVSFEDDLVCVVLTTSITVMPDDDDDDDGSYSPLSPRHLASSTDAEDDDMKKKNKNKNKSGKGKAKPETYSSAATTPTPATTENPMTTPTTNATGAPVAVTASDARAFLIDFGWDAEVLKTVKDEDVIKTHSKVKAGLEKHTPKPVAAPATASASTVVTANATTETAKVPTTEEFLASAPAEIRQSIEAGMRMHAQHKDNLVKKILANARNKFSEQALRSFDVGTLENLAELAVVPDYSGMAPAGGGIHAQTQQVTVNEADQPYAPPPPRLGLNTQENRGVMKKDAA